MKNTRGGTYSTLKAFGTNFGGRPFSVLRTILFCKEQSELSEVGMFFSLSPAARTLFNDTLLVILLFHAPF